MRITQLSPAGGYTEGVDGSRYPTIGSWEVHDLPYLVTVEMDVVAGKPVCRRLIAQQRRGGAPVTRRGLNSLPIGEITETIAARWSLQFQTSSDGKKIARPSSAQERAEIKKALRSPTGRPRDPEARRQLVERVASLYQELIDNGIRHPKPVIAEQLGYSTSYIGALVAEARAAKLLGKPEGPGRAGNVRGRRTARAKQGE